MFGTCRRSASASESAALIVSPNYSKDDAMQGSTPQHYTIADFLKWNDDNELVLNPKFQRGSVWPAPARTYLIDSILRGYPIPKLLLRTNVDRDSRRTIRDVVDGQQRLRTIIDFASPKSFPLGPKAGEELRGKRYQDLSDELKDSFLSYKLTCEQLLNASDLDVLEVFVRINSYAVPVNEPELRNARFENDFSDLVKDISQELKGIWDLGILSQRDIVRMNDQSLVAEVLGYWIDGVRDGGETQITKLYEQQKSTGIDDLPPIQEVITVFMQAADLIQPLAHEPIAKRPHFSMLVAALMYAHKKLPEGKLDFSKVPAADQVTLDTSSIEVIQDSLRTLNAVLSAEDEETTPARLSAFRDARATTQRMRSRKPRFEFFCRALTGEFSGR